MFPIPNVPYLHVMFRLNSDVGLLAAGITVPDSLFRI